MTPTGCFQAGAAVGLAGWKVWGGIAKVMLVGFIEGGRGRSSASVCSLVGNPPTVCLMHGVLILFFWIPSPPPPNLFPNLPMSVSNPTSPLVLRSATPADVLKIAFLIRQLAIYEQLEGQMVGDPQDLSRHLFGERPYAEAILAEWDGESVGLALFFHNYSTFLMQPGLYLEDLFVMPHYRGRGVGKALLQYLARLAVERGCGRFEWSVLDWNSPAIEFYQSQGAQILEEWRICRITGEALTDLASASTIAPVRFP